MGEIHIYKKYLHITNISAAMGQQHLIDEEKYNQHAKKKSRSFFLDALGHFTERKLCVHRLANVKQQDMCQILQEVQCG